MTTVNLGAVWLNKASDLTDAQAFNNVIVLKVAKAKDGSVRALANGRLRIVTTSTEQQVYELTLELCTRTQITWLEDRVGVLMCLRDDRGRKVYGTYFQVTADENVARSDYTNATLTFYESTHSEVV